MLYDKESPGLYNLPPFLVGPDISRMRPKSRALRFSFVNISCLTQLIGNTCPITTSRGAYTGTAGTHYPHSKTQSLREPQGSFSSTAPHQLGGKVLSFCLDLSSIQRRTALKKKPNNKKGCYKRNYRSMLGSIWIG